MKVELIASGGGAFEVVADDQLLFSKLASGRFPANEEIFEAIEKVRNTK